MPDGTQILQKQEKNYNRRQKKQRRKGGKRTALDYVIWIDLPINIAIFGYVLLQISRAFQTGIDVVLSRGIDMFDSGTLNMMFICCVPFIVVDAILLMIIEIIYIITKMRGKEPNISEKYSIAGIIGQVVVAGFLIASVLIF